MVLGRWRAPLARESFECAGDLEAEFKEMVAVQPLPICLIAVAELCPIET
jgi:hypothetical protein